MTPRGVAHGAAPTKGATTRSDRWGWAGVVQPRDNVDEEGRSRGAQVRPFDNDRMEPPSARGSCVRPTVRRSTMTTHPYSSAVRERLIAAQRAESAALKLVEAAERASRRAAAKAAAADLALARAQAGVVDVSGLERAALLLDVDATLLRRRVRDATPSPVGGTRRRPRPARAGPRPHQHDLRPDVAGVPGQRVHGEVPPSDFSSMTTSLG